MACGGCGTLVASLSAWAGMCSTPTLRVNSKIRVKLFQSAGRRYSGSFSRRGSLSSTGVSVSSTLAEHSTRRWPKPSLLLGHHASQRVNARLKVGVELELVEHGFNADKEHPWTQLFPTLVGCLGLLDSLSQSSADVAPIVWQPIRGVNNNLPLLTPDRAYQGDEQWLGVVVDPLHEPDFAVKNPPVSDYLVAAGAQADKAFSIGGARATVDQQRSPMILGGGTVELTGRPDAINVSSVPFAELFARHFERATSVESLRNAIL